jgi:hypothetical protein
MPKKKVVVNKKFMMDLADLIYNPSTRRFLRLCDGKLQNGPDPTNTRRPMHCGLGELYFAMTGKQPHETHVDEDGVVDLAVELSTLPDTEREKEKIVQHAQAAIKKLNLPSGLKEHLVDSATDFDIDIKTTEKQFRELLGEIPKSNDDTCGDACNFDKFRARSARVAKQIRAAAKVLPA